VRRTLNVGLPKGTTFSKHGSPNDVDQSLRLIILVRDDLNDQIRAVAANAWVGARIDRAHDRIEWRVDRAVGTDIAERGELIAGR
jgi:hypothetical protein